MLSVKAPRASVPSIAPARRISCSSTSLDGPIAAIWSRPGSSRRCRSTSSIAKTHPANPYASCPVRPRVRSSTLNVTGMRQKSIWTLGRRGVRARHSWHRPGCSWVASGGDPRTTPRDQDCPGCQKADEMPFEYSNKELNWERHLDERLQQLDKYLDKPGQQMERSFERSMAAFERAVTSEPYEWLFGSSNRRLWPETNGCRRETTSSNLSAQERQNPIQSTRETFRAYTKTPKDPSQKPEFNASYSWNESSVDSKGQRVKKSGDYVYDPISNRMVPRPSTESKAPSSIGPKVPSNETANTSLNSRESGPESTRSSSLTGNKVFFAATENEQTMDSINGAQSANERFPSIVSKEIQSSGPVDMQHEKQASVKQQVETRQEKSDQQQKNVSSVYPSQPTTAEETGEKPQHPPRLISSLDRHAAKGSDSPRSKFFDEFFGRQSSDGGPRGTGVVNEQTQSLDSGRSIRSVPAAKRKMEESWKREHAVEIPVKQPPSSPRMPNPAGGQPVGAQGVQSTSVGQRTEQASPPSSRTAKDNNSPDEIPSHGSGKYEFGTWRSVPNKPASPSTFTKQKPIKSMSYPELTSHRLKMQKHFARQQPPTPKPTKNPADCKLQDEIKGFKQAMTAFENKWRQRTPTSTQNPSQPPPVESTPTDPLAHELIAGEGDMDPGVIGFAQNGRWYKKKAPHADATPAQLHAKDTQLVKELREAYESAYGTIDVAHKQGALLQDSTPRRLGFAPKASPSSSSSEKPTSTPVNPIDLTGQPATPTPVTGNFASPTGFVNHDIPSPPQPQSPPTPQPTLTPRATPRRSRLLDGHRNKPRALSPSGRTVRREEPVFSGQLRKERYTIPEIVELLKTREKVPDPTPSMTESSGGDGHACSAAGKHKRRRSKRTFRRTVKYTAAGMVWVAACCYGTGVVIEYFREGPHMSEGERRPNWEEGRWVGRKGAEGSDSRGRLNKKGGWMERLDGEGRREERRGWRDMPLGGMEYPLLGVLAGCVWYLVGGGS